MKKIVITLLIGLGVFSLVGCGNEVTYKEIDEEQLASYYTEEKINEATANYLSITKYSYKFDQIFPGMVIYHLSRFSDVNYYYQRGEIESEETNTITDELFIGSENVEECRYYIYDGENRETKEGVQAKSFYNYSMNNDNNIVTRGIKDPLYLASQYMNSTNPTYCLGSNKTLKIMHHTDDETIAGYTIVNLDNLVPTTVFIKYKEYNDGYLKYNIKLNSNFKHKTPKELGF